MTCIRRLVCAAFVAVLPAISAAQAETCALDKLATGSKLAAPPVRLAYRIVGGAVKVGAPFTIEVAACIGADSAPRRIRVDARMPAHGHGMNYTPSESKLGAGHSRFEGLVFHMPGRWEISFDVFSADARKRLSATLDVN
ncbi:MAG: hypothetical protein OEQ29_24820, partial [Alphaproteobacteria bacterium]|nr:hypothetical protein [Alphaproteobacteria bacterium]